MTHVLNEIKVRHQEAQEELELLDDDKDKEKAELKKLIEQYKQAPASLNILTGRVCIVMK